jgi:putative flippase GtrA
MTALPALAPSETPLPLDTPTLDVVVPIYNEETDLEASVRRLHAHLWNLPYRFRITIADNASTDRSPEVARRLADEFGAVRVLRLEEKGRGRALRQAWLASDAEVLCYMDVDLSTSLDAFLPLVAPLISGHSHIAIGSRLAAGANVERGFKREFISRSYNLILRGTLAAGFSDAQCGFKAVRRDVAAELLPHVIDNEWFFDTELLVLAERSGLRIHEVPVDWIDDPDSRVDIVSTAVADLKGVARLGRTLLGSSSPAAVIRERLRVQRPQASFAGQVARFVTIGLLSTLAYIALYWLARQWWPAQSANLAALVITAVANTAANRRFTFGVEGRRHLLRHHAQGLLVFGLGLALTAGSLFTLHTLAPDAARSAEIAVLVVANLVTTIVRFLALRVWVFAAHRRGPEVAR